MPKRDCATSIGIDCFKKANSQNPPKGARGMSDLVSMAVIIFVSFGSMIIGIYLGRGEGF